MYKMQLLNKTQIFKLILKNLIEKILQIES